MCLGRGQRVWISAAGEALREHAVLSVRRIEIDAGKAA